MKRFARSTQSGFSLVELLAVVLILSVLAAVAVPLYVNTRKSSASRACKANIAAVAAAQSAYLLRNGQYAGTLSDLTQQPEGLAEVVTCPAGGKNPAYVVTRRGNGEFSIRCRHAEDHARLVGEEEDYRRLMPAPVPETVP